MRNSQIWDRTLKEGTGTVRAEPISGGGAEGRSRLSVEPWGLQHLAVEGGPRCRAEELPGPGAQEMAVRLAQVPSEGGFGATGGSGKTGSWGHWPRGSGGAGHTPGQSGSDPGLLGGVPGGKRQSLGSSGREAAPARLYESCESGDEYGAGGPLGTQGSRRDWAQRARRLRRDGRCPLDWGDERHPGQWNRKQALHLRGRAGGSGDLKGREGHMVWLAKSNPQRRPSSSLEPGAMLPYVAKGTLQL